MEADLSPVATSKGEVANAWCNHLASGMMLLLLLQVNRKFLEIAINYFFHHFKKYFLLNVS